MGQQSNLKKDYLYTKYFVLGTEEEVASVIVWYIARARYLDGKVFLQLVACGKFAESCVFFSD